MTEKALSAFKIVKDQVDQSDHERPRSANSLYGCLYEGYIGGVLVQLQGGREKPCVLSRIGYRTKQPGGGDGARTLRFRILRQEA